MLARSANILRFTSVPIFRDEAVFNLNLLSYLAGNLSPRSRRSATLHFMNSRFLSPVVDAQKIEFQMGMKTLLIVAVVILSGGQAWADPTSSNIVPNSGFEEGDAETPLGWKFGSWKESAGEWEDGIAFSGKRSLKLTGLDGGWSAAIPVSEGSVFNLKLRYRSVGGDNKIVAYARDLIPDAEKRVLLYHTKRAMDSSNQGAFVDGDYVAGADENGWATFDAGSFSVPAGVESLSLLIKLVGGNPSSMLWIDEIEILEAPKRAVPDTAVMLQQVPGASVWWEDENRKVFADSTPPRTEQEEGLRVELAQGEVGCVQLVVTPDSDWEEVRWEWDDFSGAGAGAVSKTHLRCRLVETIPIRKPISPFAHEGMIPDPLTDKIPCLISGGKSQAFWFTVSPPRDLSPGSYQTQLRLMVGAKEVCSLPLGIQIREFAIPRRPTLDVYSGFRASLVRAAEQGDVEEVTKRYYESFFDHRTRCAPAVPVGVRVVRGEVVVNADNFVERLRYIQDRFGEDRYFLPSLWISHAGDHRMPAEEKWKGIPIFSNAALTELNPEFKTRFLDYMSQVVTALKEEGVFGRPRVRFFDEPNFEDEETLNGLKTLATLMNEIDPEITVALTATRPHPALTDVIRSWTLHTDAWDRNRVDIVAAREKGCSISVYNNGVNYPESASIRIRLWPWMLKKYEVDGVNSWWGTVCWRNAMADPWNGGEGGSGVLLYPPRDDEEQGPIESIRWELFRQGMQDYEYFVLAERLVEQLEAAGDSGAATIGREAIEKGLSLVHHWPRVRPANDEPYTLDVSEVSSSRRALADAIEAMQKSLLSDP